MTFNKTQPADTTKIRNLGVVIRPNWVSIEEGDSSFRPYALNFQNRTPLGVANDPDTIADTYILYEKDDGAGNPELFGKDGSGNIIQFTEGGCLGSKNTDICARSITIDGGLIPISKNSLVTAWSNVVVSGGSITSQTNYGMSWNRVGNGVYTATFSVGQVTNANYAVVGTSATTGLNPTMLCLNSNVAKTTSGFGISIYNLIPALTDTSFSVAVLGGR
jgi:hypothetical protein